MGAAWQHAVDLDRKGARAGGSYTLLEQGDGVVPDFESEGAS